MSQVIICIFIILIVAKLNKIVLPIFKVLNAIFEGLKWLVYVVLECIICTVILFFIYGEYKLNLSIAATVVLNIIILIIKKIKRRKHVVGSYYSTRYVLNKKTGVIHETGSESANNIKENHRVKISDYDAEKLVSRGTRYRYKK